MADPDRCGEPEPRRRLRRIHPVVAAVLTFWAINTLIWLYVAGIVMARHMMASAASPLGG